MEQDLPQYWSEPLAAEIYPADTVQDDNLKATLAYWLRLKGKRNMPTRSEISPREIKHQLPLVHLYEVIGDGEDFRARLVGTSVYPGLDRDQTGLLVSKHPDPGVRLRFSLILRHVTTTRAPVRSLSRRRTGTLLHDMRAEGLWLPLGELDRVTQILAQSSLMAVTP